MNLFLLHPNPDLPSEVVIRGTNIVISCPSCQEKNSFARVRNYCIFYRLPSFRIY